MNKPLLILGGGGHASVLVDILLEQRREIVGVVSPELISSRSVFGAIPQYFNDEDILSFSTDEILLVNGIGSLPKANLRTSIYKKYNKLGYIFETVVSLNALVSRFSRLEQGVQIFPGAIIQAGSNIGENSIINTGVIVEHDCTIGINNHIAPGVTLSGGVSTGDQVHIGTGASVIQSIRIGSHSVVSSGAVVTKCIGDNKIAYHAKGITRAIKNHG